MAHDTDGSIPPPQVRLALAVTGHRAGHAGYSGNEAAVSAALEAILDCVEGALAGGAGLGPLAPVRLHALLADGTDRLAARAALARGYELVAPLPFGRRLNRAINSLTEDPAEARELLAGGEGQAEQTRAHARAIRELTDQARVFSLADGDDELAALFLARLDHPEDRAAAQLFAAECSKRVALAGRVLIEQSDLLIAVWDGISAAHVGGTGDTICAALDRGVPVVWIDPAAPDGWHLLQVPEDLAAPQEGDPDARAEALIALVRALLDPRSTGANAGFAALDQERWQARSNPLAHGYRLIEKLFGGEKTGPLAQRYAVPGDQTGSVAAPEGGDGEHGARLNAMIRHRFVWLDGISARLSDAYRGGMTVNFALSSLAIVAGVAYLPFADHLPKWLFASIELLLLVGVLVITLSGQRRRLHGRWFETRRAAEYLRHAPLLLQIGAARPAGQWPRGAGSGWPEFYARQAMREVGLPRLALSKSYLRSFLVGPLADHVRGQRDYHLAKARRLVSVHHKLDHLSERLFQFAVFSVALYLVLNGAAALHLVDDHFVHGLSKYFTVLGVLFPTFGAGIAGLRYFGDFERFGEISQVSGERLAALGERIDLLAAAPIGRLHYGAVADLVHAADEAVVAELESWQAVFGGKKISVPV